jgi:LacI family transcriptional regulator
LQPVAKTFQVIKKSFITVKDIAARAGLSPSSVSAVLNNRQVERRISEESVQKVLQAARALGYVPNIAARRLRDRNGGNHQVIVAILTSYEAPVRLVSQALRALEEVMGEEAEKGIQFSVSIEIFHAGQLRELPGLIEGRRFNAAIITNTIAEDDEFLASVNLPFPVVLLGRQIPGYPSVCEEPGRLGREASGLLLSIGRQKLAVLCPELLTQATRGRVNAFSETVLRDTGRLPDRVISSSLSAQGGYEAMRSYLAAGGDCDGIFTVTDSLAVGAYHAIKESGRKIPASIAVVGVGDHETGAFLDPPLSSFSNAHHTMNRKAAEMLVQMLRGENVPQERFEVPVETRLRESTGNVSEFSRG